MSLDEHAYLQRARAESFGAVAADYDRYRPTYPDLLMDDLVALRARTVLDIGCGTGKAATLLAARGLAVLGVEPDSKMAAVARAHGLEVEVEVGGFEDWDDRGRTFDLIIAAQAWHWVDPARGAAKAARLLTENGTLALFWNFDELDVDTRKVVDAVYRRRAPELVESVVTGGNRASDKPYADQLRLSGAFGRVETRDYRWSLTYETADWLAMVGTHSDHLLLAGDKRAALLADLGAGLGPQVHSAMGTYLILARVAG